MTSNGENEARTDREESDYSGIDPSTVSSNQETTEHNLVENRRNLTLPNSQRRRKSARSLTFDPTTELLGAKETDETQSENVESQIEEGGKEEETTGTGERNETETGTGTGTGTGINGKEHQEETSESVFSGFKRRAKTLGTSIKSKTDSLHFPSTPVSNGSITKMSAPEKNILKHKADLWMAKAEIRHRDGKKPTLITNRKMTKLDASKYRRGPIPIESLPSSDRGLLKTTHGTIESDDEDERICRPSSRGLLVYFARLGQSNDEDEKVDLNFVGSLLEAGANVNHQDRYGQTALHAIARDWHIDVARYALEHGAMIDKADKYGRTPLHLAAAVDHHEMVEYLALNGANIDQKSKEGQTPLHFACRNSAVNSIKQLIKLGAKMNERDDKLRTPLFVAAESGRAEAVQTLLDAETPAGVYDINGNSAMALMVEKMPAIAYAALSQFHVDDRALRRRYYYLNQLESEVNQKDRSRSFAKTALEMIVVYKETDLVMHPVIQKMISVKWNKFARLKSWIELIINLVYTLIWIILALLIPRDGKFHTPLTSKPWRIVLEAIFVILSVYFAIKEIRMSRQMRKIDLKWREWTIRNLESELENCHPKWPDERKYIESEINRVWNFSGTYSRNMAWSVFEWLCLSSVLAVAGTQVWYELHPNNTIAYKLYSIVLSFSVMMVCLRLMKICRAFTFLSAFIVLLGHVFGATMKFAFLFFEFFIPYVCIIWVIFGGSENAEAIEKLSSGSKQQFETFDEIVYITWLMTVTADIPFGAMVKYERELASIIVGTYYALVSVVCINLYIALMSETFTRVYENAEANASLQQALLIIFLERLMGPQESAETRKYFRKKCSPLEDIEYEQGQRRSLKLENETNVVLGNLNRQLSAVTEAMEGSPDERNDDTESENKVMDELKKKSRGIRNNQEVFVKQMKESLDDVVKAQEGITKSLNEIVSKTFVGERRGRGTLQRSRSSQSLS